MVCPYALSAPGGVQGQVSALATALVALGCDVAVVAPEGRGRAPGDAPGDGGGDRSGPVAGARFLGAGRAVGVPANGSTAPVALSPVAARRAIAAIRSFRPDVVHVHEPFVPAVALATVLGRVAPTIGTFHRAGAGPLYRAIRPLARSCVSRLSEVVAVSEAARDTLLSVAGPVAQRCTVVPNGVATERFEHAEPWPSSAPTVVFVGRLEKRKGADVLLEAFGHLPDGARLWVVGDGPEAPALRRRFGGDPRVEWCGRIDDDLVARRMAGADVLVAPSLGGESFGVVLLEAMASGTAVVASDLPGYRLAAGGAARLVPPRDAARLAMAVRDLLEDDLARRDLVASGRARAAACSIDGVARRYLRSYESVAGASTGPGEHGHRLGAGDT